MATTHLNTEGMKPLRRSLRRKMTAAEVVLWTMIKNKQLCDARFLRQYSVDKYIIDFYCSKYKLAVELGGEVHNNEQAIAYDKRRTDYLNNLGIQVLRFENFEIYTYPQRTLEEIERYLLDENLIPPIIFGVK